MDIATQRLNWPRRQFSENCWWLPSATETVDVLCLAGCQTGTDLPTEGEESRWSGTVLQHSSRADYILTVIPLQFNTVMLQGLTAFYLAIRLSTREENF